MDGTREIKAWILSFGRHAEVLEPEELRAEMEQEVEAIAEVYKAKPEVEKKSQPIRLVLCQV